MRPGYTALIEWGWLPYLSNEGKYISNVPQFYDILDKGETNRNIIFKDLFDKSKASSGNYDAMYGYIKNYQWNARPDGGYDCQTTIISTGEIIESLKVNYQNTDTDANIRGLLQTQIASGTPAGNFQNYYAKNILAGLWYETYSILSEVQNFTFKPNSLLAGGVRVTSPFGLSPNTEGSDTIVKDNKQCYLPLSNVIGIINTYVTKEALTISLNENTITGDGSDLLCVAHPLQVSVDPTVCLISSPLWQNGELIATAEKEAQATALSPAETTSETSFNLIREGYKGLGKDTKKLIQGISEIKSEEIYNLVNEKIKQAGDYDNLQDVLREELQSGDFQIIPEIEKILKTNAGITVTYKINPKNNQLDSNSITLPAPKAVSIARKTIVEKAPQALANLEFLKSLGRPYFYNGDPYTEIGTIKNIYVNVDFLYKLSINSNLESQDKKEKNEINVYNYLKSMISAIQASLGNTNNFEIHVDPNDSQARIIDVNYTEPKKSAYESLFELQVHNLQSIVRSYSLQSQIFPEQSAIIAIGSQAKGGQLGMQNNTMIDFNRNLIDRIIPTKEFNNLHNNPNNNKASTQLNDGLATLINLFNSFNTQPTDTSTKTDTNVTFSDGKNALRDLIVYFQSITSSPGKNRNLIPVKFSLEMDGIGGLVIGHMFRLPSSVLPRGYRGEAGIGSQLGQAVTSIGHTISNNDWVTKIDALNIVLNDNTSLVPFATLDLSSIIRSSINPSATTNALVSLEQKISSFGKIDNSVPIEARPFLDLIAFTEGTAGVSQNGYDIIVGYGKVPGWTETYAAQHPDTSINIPGVGKSSAAGRYQFLKSVWDQFGENYKYTFSKKGQDLAGYNLLVVKRQGKNSLKEAFDTAKQQIEKNEVNINNNPSFLKLLDIMSYEWASLPDSKGNARYGNQGGKYNQFSAYRIFIEAVKLY